MVKLAAASNRRRNAADPRWETPKPPGVAGSYGHAAIRWAERELGITVSRWQARAIVNALRHDRDGNLVHSTILLSTARQNGKSVIVRVIVGWMLDEGRTIAAFDSWRTMLAAAHDAKQARIIYKAVYGDLSGIKRLRDASRGSRYDRLAKLTEQFGIEVGNLAFDTVTSQPGSARGLAAGLVAWDEMLTQEDWGMWEVLSPTQSAQRNPLMILTSTAGFDTSIVLRAFYDRLVRQATGDEKPDPSFYGAWWQSDDPDAGLDWRALKQANPSMVDGRPAKAFVAREYAILPPSSWRRERLNHWVEAAFDGAFAPGVWAALRSAKPLDGIDPPFHLGVDIQPGWERASIYVAALRPDGRIGVEVYRDLRASDAPITADSLIEAIDGFPDPVATVTYDAVSGAAAAFERHAPTTWGVEWQAAKPNIVAKACMDVTEMIISGKLAVDDPLLDAQIALTAKRPVGQDGAFRFGRAVSAGPIDAVMAMTFAVHGAANVLPPPRML